MGLRDLRAGTTAVIGDSCPASEIDILTADITEIISSKLAEGSNIESTIVQALQDILADSHTNVKNLFGDASSFGATAAGDDPSTPRSPLLRTRAVWSPSQKTALKELMKLKISQILSIQAKEKRVTPKSRHTLIKYHWIRDCVQSNHVIPMHVGTVDNLADPHSKAVSRPVWKMLHEKMSGYDDIFPYKARKCIQGHKRAPKL